jgi:hypothetical protein
MGNNKTLPLNGGYFARRGILNKGRQQPSGDRTFHGLPQSEPLRLAAGLRALIAATMMIAIKWIGSAITWRAGSTRQNQLPSMPAYGWTLRKVKALSH